MKINNFRSIVLNKMLISKKIFILICVLALLSLVGNLYAEDNLIKSWYVLDFGDNMETVKEKFGGKVREPRQDDIDQLENIMLESLRSDKLGYVIENMEIYSSHFKCWLVFNKHDKFKDVYMKPVSSPDVLMFNNVSNELEKIYPNYTRRKEYGPSKCRFDEDGVIYHIGLSFNNGYANCSYVTCKPAEIYGFVVDIRGLFINIGAKIPKK